MEVYAVIGLYGYDGADELTLRLFSDLTEAQEYNERLMEDGATSTTWRCLTLNDET